MLKGVKSYNDMELLVVDLASSYVQQISKADEAVNPLTVIELK